MGENFFREINTFFTAFSILILKRLKKNVFCGEYNVQVEVQVHKKIILRTLRGISNEYICKKQ